MSSLKTISDSILLLLKITIRAFYTDSHIIVVNIILNSGYASEYKISEEMGISLEKVRIIMNSLFVEKFIRFEERLFKQLKNLNINKRKNSYPKIYKLRYWYIDYNYLILNLKKKIKKILSPDNTLKNVENPFFMMCSRKICKKKFSFEDLPNLIYNNTQGKFLCDNFLNLKVICGAQLEEFSEEACKNINFSKNEKKRTIEELKPLISMLLIQNRSGI